MKQFLLAALFLSGTAFAQTQISNADFENWTGDAGAKDRPVDWEQLNHTLPSPLDAFVPQTCFKTQPGYNSSTCLRLLTVSTFQGPANGIATTGTIDYNNQIVTGGVPFTDRPDSLTGYYKCSPASGDNGTVEITLMDNAGDTIGRALFATPGTAVSAWTYFSVPVVYAVSSAPDKAVALVSSSNGYTAVVGSEITVDQLHLVYNPQAVTENTLSDIDVITRENTVMLSLNDSHLKNPQIEIYDLTGKIIYTQSLNNNQINYFTLNATTGIYIYRIITDKNACSGKIFIQQ